MKLGDPVQVSDNGKRHCKGSPFVRLWLEYWRAQDPESEHRKFGPSTYQMLGAQRQILLRDGFTDEEALNFVDWFWVYKHPKMVELGLGERVIPVSAAILLVHVKEFRTWCLIRQGWISRVGFRETLLKHQVLDPPPVGWKPPAQWTG